jgi:hypothetical protein
MPTAIFTPHSHNYQVAIHVGIWDFGYHFETKVSV